MRTATATVAACLLTAAALTAQNPRTPQVVDTATTAAHPAVASVGNVTALAYVDDASMEVYVVTSDDDGLTWSAPTLLSTATGTKTVEPYSVQILGDRIYVAWDNGSDVYLNYFDGMVWTGEQAIPKPVAVGTGNVRDWRYAVSQGMSGINVVILESVDPTGAAPEDLYVSSSQDGGATFGPAVYVPTDTPGTADVDDIGLAMDGDTAYAIWVDDRATLNNLFLQKSTDGGATWATFASEVQINDTVVPAGDVQFGVGIAFGGGTLGIVWQEERPDGGNEQLRGVVSTDGGATFSPDNLIGNYTPVVNDTDFPAVHVTDSGVVVAVWEDNRTGSDEIYSARTTDAGATWGADVQLSVTGGGFPRLTGSGDTVVCAFTDGNFPNVADTAYSLDGGATFTHLTVSANSGDVDFNEVAFNASSENVVSAYLADDLGVNDVYAGGYSVCGPAMIANRTAGSNVASYTATGAVLGGTFSMTVDVSLTGHTDALVLAYSGAAMLPLANGQFFLLDPGSNFLFSVTGPGPQATLTMSVPNDPHFCGFSFSTQAVHFGGLPTISLSNAQDVTAGAF